MFESKLFRHFIEDPSAVVGFLLVVFFFSLAIFAPFI
ncbi:MAG: hypothetical protein ACOCZX_04050, partial [Candidatus Bipolaricaulota bacterium]